MGLGVPAGSERPKGVILWLKNVLFFGWTTAELYSHYGFGDSLPI